MSSLWTNVVSLDPCRLFGPMSSLWTNVVSLDQCRLFGPAICDRQGDRRAIQGRQVFEDRTVFDGRALALYKGSLYLCRERATDLLP